MRILFSFVFISVWAGCLFPAFSNESEIQLRRPIALAVSGDGTWLYVANRDSGTISIIPTTEKTVATELTVGGRLSDLALGNDHTLLTLDEKNHQLVLLTGNRTDWKVAARQTIAAYPVRLKLASQSGRCYITSLWSQTVSLVEFKAEGLESNPRLTVTKTLPLPFEPREMVLTSDEKHLIVADAFGGNLAVIAAETLKLIKTKTLPGHNIRGLAESQDGKRLLVVQQELNPLARTTEDDVHWGNLLMNLLVSLSLSDLCYPQQDAKIHRTLIPLGGPGEGAGDPGAIHQNSTGKTAVLLTGGNEVALAEEGNTLSFQRIGVGRRPVALAALPDGRLFVANMFSDSISIVDLIAQANRRSLLGEAARIAARPGWRNVVFR